MDIIRTTMGNVKLPLQISPSVVQLSYIHWPLTVANVGVSRSFLCIPMLLLRTQQCSPASSSPLGLRIRQWVAPKPDILLRVRRKMRLDVEQVHVDDMIISGCTRLGVNLDPICFHREIDSATSLTIDFIYDPPIDFCL